MLREVAQTAIARIQKVWPHLPIEVHSIAPVTTIVQHFAGRGQPKKIVSTQHHPHTPSDVIALFITVKCHMVREEWRCDSTWAYVYVKEYRVLIWK